MVLLDTNILSNLLKKNPSPRLLQMLSQTDLESQFTSSITLAELVYGAHLLPNPDILLQRIAGIIKPRKILPFDHECSYVFGKIKADMKKNGVTVDEPDLRIGTIALLNQMTIVTGNVKHFALIPGLTVENWL